MGVGSRHLRLPLALLACLLAFGVSTAAATPAPSLNPDWHPTTAEMLGDKLQVVAGPAGSNVMYQFAGFDTELSTDSGATWSSAHGTPC